MLYYVNTPGSGLFLRRTPNTISLPVDLLPHGTTVIVTDENGYGADAKWFRVYSYLKPNGIAVVINPNTPRYVYGGYLVDKPVTTPFTLPFKATDRGIHTSAGGWRPNQDQLNIVRANRMKVAFIAAYQPTEAEATINLLDAYSVTHYIIRATGFISPDPVIWAKSAAVGIASYRDAIRAKNPLAPLLVQLHNEPNLRDEGLGYAWRNGAAYNKWFIAAAKELRARFPGIRIGFSPMSPGGAIDGVRDSETSFYTACSGAIAASDWFSVHCYWTKADASDLNIPYGLWRRYAQGKPIVCTESAPAIGAANITVEAGAKMYREFAYYGVPVMPFLLDRTEQPLFLNADWSFHKIVVP